MYFQAQTPEEIDEIKAMTTKVVETDADDNYVSKDMPVIGIPVRAMIDMMAFIGAYGHKSMYESQVRTRQDFFANHSKSMLLISRDKKEKNSGILGIIIESETQWENAVRQLQSPDP